MSKLARVLDHRLSRMEGDYTASYDEGENYFEVEISWEDGSETPVLKELAVNHLLPLKGYRAGWARRDYFNQRARLYCEEDTLTAFQVISETLPGMLEPERN